MFAKYICALLVVGVVVARDLKGVDPNSLSCDPLGQIHLLLPHYHDCHKFFTCDHGYEVEFVCPSPLIFDFEEQTCNWPRATKCWLREEKIDGSGDDSAEWNPEDKSGTTVSDEDASKPDEKPVEFQPSLNCALAESADRQVPYQGDCQRFWRCKRGELVSAFCADGLFFNPKSQQCDFEANVKCNNDDEDELKGEYIVYK